MIPACSRLVCVQQPLSLTAATLIIGIFLSFGDGHVDLLGQVFHSLAVGKMLHLLDKLHHIATSLAAEAVIEILFAVYGEGRGFLVMEGTQAPIAGAVFLERHISRYHLNDIHAGVKIIHPGGGKSPGHRLSPFLHERIIRRNSRFSCNWTQYYCVFCDFSAFCSAHDSYTMFTAKTLLKNKNFKFFT